MKKIHSKKLFNNFSWQLLDRLVRGAGTVLINIFIGRKLGVENYGTINYCLALLSFFQVISTFGLDAVVIKKLASISEPDFKKSILSETFRIRLITSLLSALLIVIFATFFEKGEERIGIYVLSFGIMFSFLDISRLYFESQMDSRYSVLSELSSFIFFLILKILILMQGLPLIYLWGTLSLELILGKFFTLVLFFKTTKNEMKLLSFDKILFVKILKESIPLMLASFSVILYMRLDQVMIGRMLGRSELGIYSAAVRLSEAWYFLPVTINTALYPYFVRIKSESQDLFSERFQLFYDILSILSFLAILFFLIFSSDLVDLLFGEPFKASANILLVHIISGIFVSLSVASNSWLNIIEKSTIVLYRTIIGAGLNFVLNLILIPQMGIMGCAIATLVSYGVSVFSILYTEDLRECRIQMLKSLNIYFAGKRLILWARKR
jgi:PST family polysaccharide transporter